MQQLDGDAGVEQFDGDSPPAVDLRRYGIDFIGGDNSGSIVFDYLSTSSEDDPVTNIWWRTQTSCRSPQHLLSATILLHLSEVGQCFVLKQI
jgi:hypothetical protein